MLGRSAGYKQAVHKRQLAKLTDLSSRKPGRLSTTWWWARPAHRQQHRARHRRYFIITNSVDMEVATRPETSGGENIQTRPGAGEDSPVMFDRHFKQCWTNEGHKSTSLQAGVSTRRDRSAAWPCADRLVTRIAGMAKRRAGREKSRTFVGPGGRTFYCSCAFLIRYL